MNSDGNKLNLNIFIYMDVKNFCVNFIGTRLIPCDFLAPVETHNPVTGGVHHEVCILQ